MKLSTFMEEFNLGESSRLDSHEFRDLVENILPNATEGQVGPRGVGDGRVVLTAGHP